MSADDTGLAEARLAVTAAATTGDAGALYHIVSGLLGEGMPFDSILFDVLGPAEQDIGTRWQGGDVLVTEEHAATAAVETVVALLAGSFDRPEEGTHLVVTAAEGDAHSLPARLIAAHLVALGYRTTFLGANVLASDLGEYLATDPPDALVLTCAMANHLPGARAVIRASHSAGVPVIVGGAAFGATGDRAAVLGADAWVNTGREIPQTLASWDPDPGVAEAGAAEPSADLLSLMSRRASVTAAAQQALPAARSGDGDPRLNGEITLLLGAVEAALLVGDDRVLVDMLRWQEDTLTAHGYDAARAVAEAVRGALETHSAAGHEALTRALGAG
jgi:MerR family transcriptional regulator, light-induced transcriptional regulator